MRIKVYRGQANNKYKPDPSRYLHMSTDKEGVTEAYTKDRDFSKYGVVKDAPRAKRYGIYTFEIDPDEYYDIDEDELELVPEGHDWMSMTEDPNNAYEEHEVRFFKRLHNKVKDEGYKGVRTVQSLVPSDPNNPVTHYVRYTADLIPEIEEWYE